MIQIFERLSCENANYFFFFHGVPVRRTRLGMWDSWVNRFLFCVRQIILLIRVVQGWDIYVQAKDIRPCKENPYTEKVVGSDL